MTRIAPCRIGYSSPGRYTRWWVFLSGMATCRRRSNEWFALQRRSSVRVVFIGGMMGTGRRGRCRRADNAVFLCGGPANLKLVLYLLCGPAGPPRQNGPMYGLLRAAVYLSGHANRRSFPIHLTAH